MENEWNWSYMLALATTLEDLAMLEGSVLRGRGHAIAIEDFCKVAFEQILKFDSIKSGFERCQNFGRRFGHNCQK